PIPRKSRWRAEEKRTWVAAPKKIRGKWWFTTPLSRTPNSTPQALSRRSNFTEPSENRAEAIPLPFGRQGTGSDRCDLCLGRSRTRAADVRRDPASGARPKAFLRQGRRVSRQVDSCDLPGASQAFSSVPHRPGAIAL